VFNPSEFDRGDVIDLMHEGSDLFTYSITDLNTGKEYQADAQAMSGRWVRLTFVPARIKGKGIRQFKIERILTDKKNTITCKKNVIENKFYKIVQDTKTGWIKSIIDLYNVKGFLIDKDFKIFSGGYLDKEIFNLETIKFVDKDGIDDPDSWWSHFPNL